jgi:hypothetical protein
MSLSQYYIVIFEEHIRGCNILKSWITALGLCVVGTSFECNDAMIYIVNKVTNKTNTLSDVKGLLDIHPATSLCRYPGDNLSIRKLDVFIGNEKTLKTVYLLSLQDPNPYDWELVLPNASDVVLALRHNWAASMRHIVTQFLTHGVLFHTVRTVPPRTDNVPSHPQYTYPKAEAFGNFRLSHFVAYQQRREHFLDTPSGAAIGRSGGSKQDCGVNDRIHFLIVSNKC